MNNKWDVSSRKMTLELSYLQALHLVVLLKKVPLETDLNGIIMTKIIDQIDSNFNKVEGIDLMIMQSEIGD